MGRKHTHTHTILNTLEVAFLIHRVQHSRCTVYSMLNTLEVAFSMIHCVQHSRYTVVQHPQHTGASTLDTLCYSIIDTLKDNTLKNYRPAFLMNCRQHSQYTQDVILETPLQTASATLASQKPMPSTSKNISLNAACKKVLSRFSCPTLWSTRETLHTAKE